MEDLLDLNRKLQYCFPDRSIFRWSGHPGQWLSFILCNGGKLFDPETEDPVKFDSPEAIRGLQYYRQLRNGQQTSAAPASFLESAITILERQSYGMYLRDREERYVFLPMPGDRPGHGGISIQATELLSVRQDGIDRGLLKPLIRFLWSEDFQDHLAELKYGIPIRRSSAEKSFAGNTPADIVFRQSCDSLCSEYRLYDENLLSLVRKGMYELLVNGADPEREISEFAGTVRQYIRYMDCFKKGMRHER